jgi:class 3 adenylate cyclase
MRCPFCNADNPAGSPSCIWCGRGLIEPQPQLQPQPFDEGTVTLLFTDIEGWTRLSQQLGDQRAHRLLQEHDRILAECVARHKGHAVKHMGDAFMAAFASATSALHCAVDMQRALAEHNGKHPETPLNVRVGLNSGESIRERNDYFGTAVTVATRIAHKARGGQILVSQVVRDLAGSMAEVAFRDVGRRQLKGIPGRQQLYEVVW